jgi:chromosome partitioning protein
MKAVTLACEKGGTGKTTLATHLAAGLAIKGKRVLLVDADAQGHATFGLGLKNEPGFYDLLVRDADWKNVLRVVPPEVYEPPDTKAKGLLAVLPGNVETQLIAQKIDNAFLIVERLEELEQHIDVVIFDTSPTPSLLHGAIYLATDDLLYPTLCETYSLNGLVSTIKHQERFSQQRRNATDQETVTMGIVPTMYRSKTVEHSENLAQLQERYGELVWPPLPMRITWAEAVTMRHPVFAIAPHSAAAREAWAVVNAAEEVMARV